MVLFTLEYGLWAPSFLLAKAISESPSPLSVSATSYVVRGPGSCCPGPLTVGDRKGRNKIGIHLTKGLLVLRTTLQVPSTLGRGTSMAWLSWKCSRGYGIESALQNNGQWTPSSLSSPLAEKICPLQSPASLCL